MQHQVGEVDQIENLVLYLVFAAKDVSIIHAETPHTQQPVQRARQLVAIDVCDFRQPHRQGATIQLDYQLPERFELEYTGADNRPHRPVMIHRAIFGTLERFVGCLIEHFAGAFPLWLAPEQVRVIPISEVQKQAAQAIDERLRAHGLRSSVDDRNDTLNYRVRDGELMKVPYMAVVGRREVEQGSVAVRVRGAGKKQTIMPVDEFEQRVLRQVRERSLGLE